MNERISREELIKVYQIEITFLDDLVSAGLVHLSPDGDTHYLAYDDLPQFERFITWHYDLEVNMPGLEVIHQLLSQMQALREENYKLIKQFQRATIAYDVD